MTQAMTVSGVLEGSGHLAGSMFTTAPFALAGSAVSGSQTVDPSVATPENGRPLMNRRRRVDPRPCRKRPGRFAGRRIDRVQRVRIDRRHKHLAPRHGRGTQLPADPCGPLLRWLGRHDRHRRTAATDVTPKRRPVSPSTGAGRPRPVRPQQVWNGGGPPSPLLGCDGIIRRSFLKSLACFRHSLRLGREGVEPERL